MVKLVQKQSKIALKSIIKLENHKDCLGITLNRYNNEIFYAANGKEIYRFDLNKKITSLVTTIKEVKREWNDDYGNTFLQDIIYAYDGFIYAAAKDSVLRIDPKTGEYETIIYDLFSGPWGAYGIDVDNNGNIIIGSHKSGIHFFDKSKDWEMTTIVDINDSQLNISSFGGVRISPDKENLYFLDFESSNLISCKLKWNRKPEVIKKTVTELNMNFPEFLEIIDGDIYIKSARENNMVRVKSDIIVEEFSFKAPFTITPFVTFILNKNIDDYTDFYSVDWGPNGNLCYGKILKDS